MGKLVSYFIFKGININQISKRQKSLARGANIINLWPCKIYFCAKPIKKTKCCFESTVNYKSTNKCLKNICNCLVMQQVMVFVASNFKISTILLIITFGVNTFLSFCCAAQRTAAAKCIELISLKWLIANVYLKYIHYKK